MDKDHHVCGCGIDCAPPHLRACAAGARSRANVRRVRTNVYVDGFNLYYGCLKGTHTGGSTSRHLRALATLPSVSIHLGSFLTKPARMPLAEPQPGGPKFADVLKTEEKGSDVNLGDLSARKRVPRRCRGVRRHQ